MNHCTRCGKPLGDQEHIHTCTPTTREEKIVRPGIYERAEEAYEAAQQRKWVGLTFDDIDAFAVSPDWIAGARWAEVKLKKKNG